MSLYARLLALSGGNIPTEDALTEVVAHLFRRDLRARLEQGDLADDALVVRWLQAIGALEKGGPPVRRVRVETQRSFATLSATETRPAHHTDSRPDLVLTLYRGEPQAPESAQTREVVFVESKVDSGEGVDQLRRYAEHLDDAFPKAARRTLVYLTHYPEQRKEADVLQHTGDRVDFRQARWHSTYRLFRAARATAPAPLLGLYDDLLDFMHHLDMDRPDHLDLADGFALTRIDRGIRFLEHTLTDAPPGTESPLSRFKRIMNSTGGQRATVYTNVVRFRRFAFYEQSGKTADAFEVLLGYELNQGDLPALYLRLASHPGPTLTRIHALHGTEVSALPGSSSWRKWIVSNGGWGGASLSVPFARLLSEEDHVREARRVFGLLLDELERLHRDASDLPWNGEPASDEPEGE